MILCAPGAVDCPAPPQTEQITVVAKRLDTARAQLQPRLGATVYTLDPKALAAIPSGSNAGLNQVLLQIPGVAQDGFGQLHVRGDHNEIQFRLNGVQLPEGLAVFGQALQTRFAHSLDLITGALPAQYGFRDAAVIDITTRTGTTNPGGEISVYGGARDDLQTALSYGQHAGRWDMFVTADAEHDRLGIENPTSSFIGTHDLSNQYHGLAQFSYIPTDTARISLTAGISNAQYQIPNSANQRADLGYNVGGVTNVNSAALDEHQREITDFAILSLQQQFGNLDVQTSIFSRYSSLYFTPDPVGDLLFAGIAQTAARSVWSNGIQSDASLRINDSHTLRAGFQAQIERSVSATSSEVFALDDTGGQVGNEPIGITDNSGRTGGQYGLYIQDEWRITPRLTLNAGGRFDVVDAFTHENQFSPRANFVWRPLGGTTLHIGYSRYFTPPQFELVGAGSVSRFAGTSAEAPGTRDDTVRAEHDNYYDVGVQQVLLPGLTVGIDAYFKQARNLIDEGQFGAPIILTAFNYAKAQAGGIEGTVSYEHGPWSFYGNVAVARAVGKQINSAQFSFDPDDLAYIAQHYIHLDHDQHWTGSGGVSYRAFAQTRVPLLLSADLLVGSGLRADGAVPNGRALDGYATGNLSAVQTIDFGFMHGLSARLDVINVLDRSYQIRDGSGVGVGAPQYGRRRTILAGLSQKF